MELIKDLGTVDSGNGRKTRLGLFYCAYCKKQVERWTGDGKRNKSCGCARHDLRVTNGMNRNGKRDPLYVVYYGIRARCYNEKNIAYYRYGGRGITICDEWLKDPPSFFKWALLSGWRKGLEIDRKENDLGYSPDNCQIVTHLINSQKTSHVKLSVEKAEAIKVVYKAGGTSHKKLGKQFDVAECTIMKIVNNHIWV